MKIGQTNIITLLILTTLSLSIISCGDGDKKKYSSNPERGLKKKKTSFECDDGQKIDLAKQDDGICDCADGSDEEKPCDSYPGEDRIDRVERGAVDDREENKWRTDREIRDDNEESTWRTDGEEIPLAYDLPDRAEFYAFMGMSTGSGVKIRITPELGDNSTGYYLTRGQYVAVLGENYSTDPNVGIMTKSLDVYDVYHHEEKLRRNYAYRIIDQYTRYDKASDGNIELFSLQSLSNEEHMWMDVPSSLFKSYYGQQWYLIETEDKKTSEEVRGWVSADFIEEVIEEGCAG